MMTEPEKRAVRRGATSAARNCGAAPIVGTLAEYSRALERAERETDRAVETWVRWRRRFDPDPDRLEIGSGRTNVRHEVAKALFEGRSETIRLLTGPAEGSA
jgi:predicted ATPase